MLSTAWWVVLALVAVIGLGWYAHTLQIKKLKKESCKNTEEHEIVIEDVLTHDWFDALKRLEHIVIRDKDHIPHMTSIIQHVVTEHIQTHPKLEVAIPFYKVLGSITTEYQRTKLPDENRMKNVFTLVSEKLINTARTKGDLDQVEIAMDTSHVRLDPEEILALSQRKTAKRASMSPVPILN